MFDEGAIYVSCMWYGYCMVVLLMFYEYAGDVLGISWKCSRNVLVIM